MNSLTVSRPRPPASRLRLSLSSLALALSGLLTSCGPTQAADGEKTDFGLVAGTVANMLMDTHYSNTDFDDEMSRKALQNYFDYLDYSRLYFTKPEIENFRQKYDTKLDNYVFEYKLTPANEIYDLYLKKVEARFVKIKALLEGGTLDFTKPETAEINRKEAPWADSEEALDDLWRKQLKREVLQERLNLRRSEERKKENAAKVKELKKDAAADGQPIPEKAEEAPKEARVPDTPEQKVLKRYERFIEAIRENDEEDVTNYFLSSITGAYDPHSEYFSAPEDESFKIDMKKSLYGIGAVLSTKDGGAEIKQLVPGGPADKAGDLHVGDIVIGVAQGLEGEMHDVEGLKLQKIVDQIRGDEGTTVRLKIIPAEDPTVLREIVIVRAKVQLKDSLAKAELVELNKPNATPVRVGWINLDGFYADMENMGKADARSATRDVKALLTRLQKEGIAGLVLDLRGNGGGSLEEAIKLTGLFIRSGPVVQQRDNRDRREARSSRTPDPVYSGPLLVLTDRASASASEIFAAALQDYGRAVIVGDKSTFGKGTVQTVLDVAQHMPLFSPKDRAGSLKVTIQKFYRINGESTQKKGVVADIPLPSRYDAMEIGEEFLKEPLPYDKIEKLSYQLSSSAPLPNTELLEKSKARVEANPEFSYVKDYVQRTQELIRKNEVSLSEEVRLSEDKANEDRNNQQKAERKKRHAEAEKEGDPYKVFPLTLDTVNDVQLKTDAETKKEENPDYKLKSDDEDAPADDEQMFPHDIDPVKAEALNIVRDLIEATAGAPAKNTARAEAPVGQ